MPPCWRRSSTEWLGGLGAVFGEGEHPSDEVVAAVELAAAEHLAGQDRREGFDLVQPG